MDPWSEFQEVGTPSAKDPWGEFKNASNGSILDPIAQGLTWGTSDEIRGIGGGVLDWSGVSDLMGVENDGTFSGGYDRETKIARDNLAAYRQRHPFVSATAEAVGTLPTAILPAGAVLRAPTLAGKVVTGAAGGGLAGGLYGYNAGEGGVKNRLLSAGETATAGAAIGGMIPLAGAGLGAAIGAGARRLSRGGSSPKVSRRASNMVMRDLEAEGTTPGEAGQQARSLGPKGMLADASETLRLRAEQIAQSDNPARNEVLASIKGRQTGAGGRIGSAYDAAMGPSPNVAENLSAIRSFRKQKADFWYDKARQKPIHFTRTLEDLLKRPSARRALLDAQKLAADEGYEFQQIFAKLDDNGNVISAERVPDQKAWDYIKRSLDDLIDSQMTKDEFGRQVATNRSRITTQLKNEILDNLDAQNPDYARARKEFSGESKVLDAFKRGRNIFSSKEHPDFLADDIKGMSNAERDALALGTRAAVDEKMGLARNGELKGRTLLDSDWNERKIVQVLGPTKGKQLAKALESEQAMWETQNQVLGNSATSRRQDNPFRSRPLGSTDLTVVGLLNKTRVWGLNKIYGDNGAARLAKELSPILTATGPRRDAIIRSLEQKWVARANGAAAKRKVETYFNALAETANAAETPRLVKEYRTGGVF